MSLQFTDEEFQCAWRELDEPQLEGGWELFTETMGVKIYRLYDKVQKMNTSAALTGNPLIPHGVNPPVSVWEPAAEPVASAATTLTKCEAVIEK